MYRFVLLALVAAAAADHSCPPVDTVADFKYDEFAQGTWYELARYKNTAREQGMCGRAEYTLEGDTFKIKNCNVLNGKERCIDGVGKLDPEAANHGKLICSYPYGPSRKMVDSKLNVIATDYKTYAILHYCKHDEANNIHMDLSWVLGRSKSISPEDREKVIKIIKDSPVLVEKKYEEVDFSEEACKITV
ncbi:bilin-binding protein-like [Aricia agestis]|uniref:bilin-binding protein-like n=1 Tax=Aricia agestis TaxID=91739 RepID=UPI001C20AFF1|nr:bilin-binding protein-like [Aricia agestis]